MAKCYGQRFVTGSRERERAAHTRESSASHTARGNTSGLFADLRAFANSRVWGWGVFMRTVDSQQLKPLGEVEKGSSYWKFELSRLKLCRKWPDKKWKLFRVSGRLELVSLRVWVIRSQLPGVLPYMGYIGMCGPKGYGFSAVLVVNRVSILAILPPFW